MMKEKNFMTGLTCEELCMLSKKKNSLGKQTNPKIERLVKKEMVEMFCEPC